jgi:hypothetical protein
MPLTYKQSALKYPSSLSAIVKLERVRLGGITASGIGSTVVLNLGSLVERKIQRRESIDLEI